MASFAAVSADPAIFISGGYLSSPLTSAALVAPGSPVAPAAPVASIASVGSVSPVAPVLSDYRYAYGSSYNYQDTYPVVNSALSLPYSLPYAYSADWYYRK